MQEVWNSYPIEPDIAPEVPREVAALTRAVVPQPPSTEDGEGAQRIYGVSTGRRLIVAIDLDQPLERIQEEVKELYELNMTFRLRRRRRENEIDHWKIYDRHKRDHIPLLQITREELVIEGLPAYDPEADAAYRRVNRAYRRAKELIAEVERQARLPI